MNKHSKVFLPTLTALLAAVLAACSSIDCPIDNIVACNYQLLKSNGSQDTLRQYRLSVLSARRDTTQTDTVLINRDQNVKTFSLPMSFHGEEDLLFFVLSADSSIYYVDTVRIRKTNVPHFESVDCTPSYFHELRSVSTSHHAIDSIGIANPSVGYDKTITHLHIFFRHDI